jgi:antitoxin VapB
MSTTAKLFMSGRSQAVRLPAKLRLQAEEVVIEQIGDALWLQPRTAPHNNLGEWLQAFYASSEPLPAEFLADRQDPPPQERDWS